MSLEPEPPFVDEWSTARLHLENPLVVAVPCEFCGAPVGGSCHAANGAVQLANHPRRIDALYRHRDALRFEAERVAAVYPARPPDQ